MTLGSVWSLQRGNPELIASSLEDVVFGLPLGKAGAGPRLLTRNTMVAMERIRPAKMVVTLRNRRASSQLKHDAIEASISVVALGLIGFSQTAIGAVQVTAAACTKQLESGIFNRVRDGLHRWIACDADNDNEDAGVRRRVTCIRDTHIFFPLIQRRCHLKSHFTKRVKMPILMT